MGYAIRNTVDDVLMWVGYSEAYTNCDGNFIDDFWYICVDDEYFSVYETSEKASNILNCVFMDGTYPESDYEIVEV